MNLGDAAVIARGQAIEDFGEPVARLPVDPPHDPEIDRRDRPVGLHEQIALVHVGVKEALGDRLAQEGVDEVRRQGLHVVPRGDQLVAVRNLDALNPIERHHAIRGAVPVDRGHFIGGHRRHRIAELRGRGGFAPQVEFAQRPAAEVRDHLPRAEPARLAAERFEMRGGPFIGFDVARELLVDAGTADLHRDLAAIGRHRAMDLRDRSRADGLAVEFAVEAFERDFESLLDFLPDTLERDRSERILQGEQVARRLLADEVGARRERLAELDRRGADRLEGRGIIGHRGLDRPEARDPAQTLDPGRGLRRALDPAQRAVAREDTAPLQQAGDMGDGSGHSAAAPSFVVPAKVRSQLITLCGRGRKRWAPAFAEALAGRCPLTPSTRCGSRRGRPGSVRPSPR